MEKRDLVRWKPVAGRDDNGSLAVVVVKVQREESSSFMTHSILFTMNVDASGLVRGFMDDGLGSCELVACNESIAEKNETEGKCYAGR